MFAGRGAKAASPSRFGASPVSDTSKPTKISREGVILIKSFEGFRPRALQRPDGRWTIGYGHTRSAREGLTVSEADAELLLQYDLIPVAQAVNAVQAPLNQHQFDALASFVFSIGVERFQTSDVLARLNAGATQDAAEALAAWVDDVDVVTPARRRATERALFFADPQAPASLAELLAAPLPPPTALLVERTPELDAATPHSPADLPETEPFPAAAEAEDEAAPVVAPWMTQDDEANDDPQSVEVETEDQTNEAVETVHAEPVDPVEPDRTSDVESDAPVALTETEAEAEAVALEAADEPMAAEPDAETFGETDADPTVAPEALSPEAEPTPSSPQPEAPEPLSPAPAARATTSAAAFYSPYAVRALGPLAGFGVRPAARPTPPSALNDDPSPAPASEAPEPQASVIPFPSPDPAPEDASTPLAEVAAEPSDDGEALVEDVAAPDVVLEDIVAKTPVEPAVASEEIVVEEVLADAVVPEETPAASPPAAAEPEITPEIEPVSNAHEPTSIPAAMAPAPSDAVAVIGSQPESEPEAKAPEIELPRFAPVAPIAVPATAHDTLTLTGAPEPETVSPEPRLVWPEHADFTHPDQTPLFAQEPIGLDASSAQEIPTVSAPVRFQWTETLTFLVMGGVGLLSFGAAMAAFRQSAETEGDIGLIGWVLVLIALACVGASAFNLYQRWGRADRA